MHFSFYNFCELGMWVSLVVSSVSRFLTGCNQGVAWLLSSQSLTCKQIIMWLLAGFSFLWFIGLRASATCWLLARTYPQFLVTWVFSVWQFASSTFVSQKGNRVNLLAIQKSKVKIFYNTITEVTYHLCHILLVGSKSLGSAYIQDVYWEERLTVLYTSLYKAIFTTSCMRRRVCLPVEEDALVDTSQSVY